MADDEQSRFHAHEAEAADLKPMLESTSEQKADAYRTFLRKVGDAIDEVRDVGVPSEEAGDFRVLTASFKTAALHFDEHDQRERQPKAHDDIGRLPPATGEERKA